MKKLVLIHGWDYKHYTSQTQSTDVWDNRRKLVTGLQKFFDIKIITLPGFCGEKEPDYPWELEDFADFIELQLQKDKFNPDYILGYSFGGAVALSHKLKYNKNKIMVLKNPFYAKGTNFLKKTYLNIVGIDMSEKLKALDKNDFIIIFGEKDTATPPWLLLNTIPEIQNNVIIVQNGTHDIANTHTQKLIKEIVTFIHINRENKNAKR